MRPSQLFAALAFSTAHGFSFQPTTTTTTTRSYRRRTFAVVVGLSATTKVATKTVVKTPEEWKSLLDEESFRVLREAGTEPPFTSHLNNVKSSDVGTFVCKGCGNPLFPAASKYDSGTGWPSFSYPVDNSSNNNNNDDDDAIEYRVDFAAILPRIECLCNSCGGHLGHVFEDGPQPTGLRYCMNGASMEFVQDQTAQSSSETTTDAVVVAAADATNVNVKLPLPVVLPGVVLNLGIAGLFLASFVNHGMVLEPSATFPLGVAAYYGYSAMVGLSRTNLLRK